MSDNKNKKLPTWAAVIITLFFFGMMIMIIGGDAIENPSLRIAGIVSLFVGIAVVIIIINAVTRARRAKGGDDGSLDEYLRNQESMYRANKLADKTPRTHVDEVMVREDLLHLAFERKKRDDLADEYDAAADVYWQKYAGDTWDENVAAIDALIDEYYAKLNPEEQSDACDTDAPDDEADDAPNVFTELFAPEQKPTPAPTPVEHTAPVEYAVPEKPVKPVAHIAIKEFEPTNPVAPVAADDVPSADTNAAPPYAPSVARADISETVEAQVESTDSRDDSANVQAPVPLDYNGRTKSSRIGYKRIGKK